jgi:hypothetical protein
MKHVKLFENFGNLDHDVQKALKTILSLYRSDCNGDSIHISEYFGEGEELMEYSEKATDDRIKSILFNMAECCFAECEGSAEHLCDWMSDDDYDYVANILGMPSFEDTDEDDDEDDDFN